MTLIAPALVYLEGLRGELEKQAKERRSEERMGALEAGRANMTSRVSQLERNQFRQQLDITQLRAGEWQRERWGMPMPGPSDEETEGA